MATTRTILFSDTLSQLVAASQVVMILQWVKIIWKIFAAVILMMFVSTNQVLEKLLIMLKMKLKIMLLPIFQAKKQEDP